MKQLFSKLTAGVLITTVQLTACAVTTHTEKAAGVDFSQYKTFAWTSDGPAERADRVNNDIVDNNIKNSVSAELGKKGWVENDNNPDVKLDYTVAVKTGMKREAAPVYTPPYPQYVYGRRGIYTLWYPSMLMGYHNYNVPFKEGELTVSMFDSKSNKLIWQGWSKGEINYSNLTSKEASAQVKSIFRKFDFPGAEKTQPGA